MFKAHSTIFLKALFTATGSPPFRKSFVPQSNKAKFGFPFVICARLNRKDAILKNLRVRYPNGIEKELNIAINQVLKICELRIRDIISSQCMLQSKL